MLVLVSCCNGLTGKDEEVFFCHEVGEHLNPDGAKGERCTGSRMPPPALPYGPALLHKQAMNCMLPGFFPLHSSHTLAVKPRATANEKGQVAIDHLQLLGGTDHLLALELGYAYESI